ncbi:MAG: hypothetical protein AAB289_07760 [Chloroflexota bacterium]
MALFTVSVRRRWFGEELDQKLHEFDHAPGPEELLELAHTNQLGGGATLHVRETRGHGGSRSYRVRDLQALST